MMLNIILLLYATNTGIVLGNIVVFSWPCIYWLLCPTKLQYRNNEKNATLEPDTKLHHAKNDQQTYCTDSNPVQ